MVPCVVLGNGGVPVESALAVTGVNADVTSVVEVDFSEIGDRVPVSVVFVGVDWMFVVVTPN